MAAASADAAAKPWYRRKWIFLLVVPALLVAALGLLLFFLVFSRVPLPDDIAAQTSLVFDVNGDEVSGLAADATREDRDLAELPEHVGQAVMGAEDRSFYDHGGISARGIARALFTNVRAGDVEQGGSTITQQYIKNAEAGREQTYARKVREAALSVKLEQAYEKDDILEFYLNTIYWGRGAYGIEAAANVYFDRPAHELDVNQAATLAGLIAAPEAWDPAENPERADERRRFALGGMLEQGWIEQDEHDDLVERGLPDVTERQRIDMGPNAWYIDSVRRELAANPEIDDNELFRGLRIHTELDPRLQELAQDTLRQAVADGPTDGGSIVSVHPATGGVRALVGGPDMSEDENNVALRAPREVGSTFKAFTLQAYLEEGNSPESRLSAPAEITIEGEDHTFNNYGNQAYGEQSVYQATASSTNTVYIQMQEEAGRERVVEATGRAGAPTAKDEEPFPTATSNRPEDWTLSPFASLTLGSETFTPLEMASSFGTWAAEGLHVTPHLVTRVENRDGATIWEAEVEENDDVELNVARTVTDALRGVVESGTGQSASIGRPAAGKTGTTQDSRDAWFVGYVPQLSTAVWLGNLDNSEIEGEGTGGGLAAPVWSEYMAAAVEPWEVEDFVRPDLSQFETTGDEPETCPSGYRFADPPDEVDDDGFYPDILTDVTDDEGRPCVEVPPEPEEEEEEEQEQCPDGYAFGEPPTDADPAPDVITDITDEDDRPCVEQSPEPDEEEDEDEDDGDEDEEGEDDGGGDENGDGDGDNGGGDGGGGDGDGGGDDDDGDGNGAGGADGDGGDGDEATTSGEEATRDEDE